MAGSSRNSMAASSESADTKVHRRGLSASLMLSPSPPTVMKSALPGWIIGAAAVVGLGFGVSASLINRRALRARADDDRAAGASALFAVRDSGRVLDAAIAGLSANMAGFGAGPSLETARGAATWVFVAALPMAILGALAAWRLGAPLRVVACSKDGDGRR